MKARLLIVLLLMTGLANAVIPMQLDAWQFFDINYEKGYEVNMTCQLARASTNASADDPVFMCSYIMMDYTINAERRGLIESSRELDEFFEHYETRVVDK